MFFSWTLENFACTDSIQILETMLTPPTIPFNVDFKSIWKTLKSSGSIKIKIPRQLNHNKSRNSPPPNRIVEINKTVTVVISLNSTGFSFIHSFFFQVTLTALFNRLFSMYSTYHFTSISRFYCVMIINLSRDANIKEWKKNLYMKKNFFFLSNNRN